VEAYANGTDFGIHAEPDGLISAGDPSTQLTWMDARRDGVVFTPRYGKAVEINALWCSGLARLAEALGPRGKPFAERAKAAAESFNRAFWNERAKCLYDVITPAGGAWVPSEEVRPNQVFAASLPHSPLNAERRRAVLAHVRERLLTPVGLRTLDAAAPGYRARYEGRLFDRDAAYHNGTVWPWLLGAYAEGLMRVGDFSKESKAEAVGVLRPLVDELLGRGTQEAPVLTIAEVYDGDEPRRAQGCIAQAWSVAETLRVMSLAAR
jgi:predicted glycogen debranching enzyme